SPVSWNILRKPASILATAPALIEAYDDELAVCRITVVPNEPLPEATAEPEATEQAIGDA
ncbi:MAG: hypothetical protein AAFV98_05150, partial [Chloroflexota bacterium]